MFAFLGTLVAWLGFGSLSEAISDGSSSSSSLDRIDSVWGAMNAPSFYFSTILFILVKDF